MRGRHMRPFVLHLCDKSRFDANYRWGTVSTDLLEILPAELVGFKKEPTRAATSAVVVVPNSVLLNKNSSFIVLSFSYRAKAIKWLYKALLVDSSS